MHSLGIESMKAERSAGIEMKDVLDELRQAFRSAGIESADLDARLIVAHILDISQARLVSEHDLKLGEAVIEKIRQAKMRRLDREPVSRILGIREFWSRAFEISDTTLDPRPDTESLIDAALEIISSEKLTDKEFTILDLGTGSGCILLTLLAECENATGVGIDIDPDALVTARKNSQRLGVGSRAEFVCGHWADPLDAQFDIVISNPPYIKSADIPNLMPEVKNFEPLMALDGGHDGLEAYREILSGLNKFLTTGWIIFEIGQGQLDDILGLLGDAGLCEHDDDCLILGDLNGMMRCVAAKARFTGNEKK